MNIRELGRKGERIFSIRQSPLVLAEGFLKGSYRKYFGWIWNEYSRTWKKGVGQYFL